MMKTGLVLEGGAMRGLFTAGVMDVLMEHGIEFDGAIGVSAGAVFGCNYKSRQIGRVLRYNLEYCHDPRYCSIQSLFKTGDLYGADFCYRQLPSELDLFDVETYNSNPMEFYVVCTDVTTGQPVYHRCDISDEACLAWFRGSASMPLVSRIVEVDGYKLLDGGISDSIPLRYFESLGYNRNVIILTQPRGYVKKHNNLVPFFKLALKEYPKVAEVMDRRHEVYNETIHYIEQKEAAGEVLVIRPDAPLPVGRTEHDPTKLVTTYNLGRAAALKQLDALKTFL